MKTLVMTLDFKDYELLMNKLDLDEYQNLEDYIIEITKKELNRIKIHEILSIISSLVDNIKINEIFSISSLLSSISIDLRDQILMIELDDALERLVLNNKIMEFELLKICEIQLIRIYKRIM